MTGQLGEQLGGRGAAGRCRSTSTPSARARSRRGVALLDRGHDRGAVVLDGDVEGVLAEGGRALTEAGHRLRRSGDRHRKVAGCYFAGGQAKAVIRTVKRPDEDAERIAAECGYGIFSRQLFLGDTFDVDHLEADYTDGVHAWSEAARTRGREAAGRIDKVHLAWLDVLARAEADGTIAPGDHTASARVLVGLMPGFRVQGLPLDEIDGESYADGFAALMRPPAAEVLRQSASRRRLGWPHARRPVARRPGVPTHASPMR